VLAPRKNETLDVTSKRWERERERERERDHHVMNNCFGSPKTYKLLFYYNHEHNILCMDSRS